MRFVLPTLLSSLLSGSVALAAPATVSAPAPPAVIGCASLANLRILLRQTGNDPAKAAALLSDDKADHLGCSILGREAVTAIADHAALNGSVYDCVAVRTTSVCQWTVAGSVTPVEQARPGRRAQPDTGKAAPGKNAQDKSAQEKTPR
ncbi:hypothetical protein [Methylobacterium sp. J-090]|uniref:hypothetical protein n=1 Tax=Methylobacterium sp. J-090 TaxID=2836666 RepID=UPI001FBB4EC3|nr:hypothetical protein [Methylobacterium sp. J-090]MCJ2082194.1 hypothetical protein [Methylobacterium sp. J-090]